MTEVLSPSPFRFNDASLARYDVDAPLQHGHLHAAAEQLSLSTRAQTADANENHGNAADAADSKDSASTPASFIEALGRAGLDVTAYGLAGGIRGLEMGSTACLPALMGGPVAYGPCVGGATLVGTALGVGTGFVKNVSNHWNTLDKAAYANAGEVIIDQIKDAPRSIGAGLAVGLAGAWLGETMVVGTLTGAAKLMLRAGYIEELVITNSLAGMKAGFVVGAFLGGLPPSFDTASKASSQPDQGASAKPK